MNRPAPENPDPLRRQLLDQLTPYGQQHVVRFWDELRPQQPAALAAEVSALDLALIDRLFRGRQQAEDWAQLLRRAEPPPAFRLQGPNEFTADEARRRGEAALRAGKVGVILVAGGQGTRLGFDRAKGLYPIGPVSQASLFQILFEKLLAVRRRFRAAIPLCLMTSPATHQETVAYLDHVERFGLPREDLVIFCQGTMPAVDCRTGRLLLADKGRLFSSPDGHGGMLAALDSSGTLADLVGRGIEQLFYMQVDNPLVGVCDPEFLGYHLLTGSELSTQAVAKRTPRDKVGNIVSIDGRLRIAEYSEFNELDDELTGRRGLDGSLVYWAGNTAVHVFDVTLLQRMARQPEGLPFHVAVKKVPYVDETGAVIEPAEPNALKFERFIFDLLPAAQRAIVVEVDEATSFAPLKNAPGDSRDSPAAVQAQMIGLHTKWLRAAGATVAEGVPLEICPLFALDAQELRGRIKTGLCVTEPTYFCET